MSLLTEILNSAHLLGVSDIFLVSDHPPIAVHHKSLNPLEGFGVLTAEDTEQFVVEMVGDRNKDLHSRRDLDFSFALEHVSRYRVNAHYQREEIALALRPITEDIPNLAALNLPETIQKFTDLPRGLVLVTGPTGSGKSTTLASMVEKMNLTQKRHIITLEDPIEYQFVSKQSLIEQREVGFDVHSFASGLKFALRQAPDVILLGEMRDLETTSAALSAAETGHLVLATLHTQSAAQTIERIVDIYPGEQQQYVLSMLANALRAVVSQALLPKIGGGMVPAVEIMLCTAAVRNCIRENRIHEIANVIETSRAEGMCTLDDSLRGLVLNGLADPKNALSKSNNPEKLARDLGL